MKKLRNIILLLLSIVILMCLFGCNQEGKETNDKNDNDITYNNVIDNKITDTLSDDNTLYYKYTTPATGRYIFVSDIELSLRVTDSVNNVVYSKTLVNDYLDLDKDTEYRIEITKKSTIGSFNIAINIPKYTVLTYTYGTTISCNELIKFNKQIDTYEYTPNRDGVYNFESTIAVIFTLQDINGEELATKNGYSLITELQNGKKYILKIQQSELLGEYTLKVNIPNSTVTLQQSNNVAQEVSLMRYDGQVDTYLFTADKDGTYGITTSLSLCYTIEDEDGNQLYTSNVPKTSHKTDDFISGKTYKISIKKSQLGEYELKVYAPKETSTLNLNELITTVNSKFDYPNEIRSFKITPTVAGEYRVNSNIAIGYALKDANGVVVASKTSGTYFYFTFELTDLNASFTLCTSLDDTGTNILTFYKPRPPRAIPTNNKIANISSSFDYNSQKDNFSLLLPLAGEYRIEFSREVYYTIIDEAGTIISSSTTLATDRKTFTVESEDVDTTYYIIISSDTGTYSFSIYLPLDPVNIALDGVVNAQERYSGEVHTYIFTPTTTATYKLTCSEPCYYYIYKQDGTEVFSSLLSSTTKRIQLTAGVDYRICIQAHDYTFTIAYDE